MPNAKAVSQIVLDASVVLDFLLALEPHAAEIARRIRAAGGALAAPHLLDAEVGQVLRRLVRAGAIDADRAAAALEDLVALPLIRYPHLPLLPRAFALRDSTTFHDALYLALAEGLGAELLTRDAALGAVPGQRRRVVVLS